MNKEFIELAKEEVSRIITAHAENWSKNRYEVCTIRLSNIFDHISKGLIEGKSFEFKVR